MSPFLSILTALAIIFLGCLSTTVHGRTDTNILNLPATARNKEKDANSPEAAEKDATMKVVEVADDPMVGFLCLKVAKDLQDLCNKWLSTQKAVEIISQPAAVIAAITFFQMQCQYGSKAANEHQKDHDMSSRTNHALSNAAPLFDDMAKKASVAIDSIKAGNFDAAEKTMKNAYADYGSCKTQVVTAPDRDEQPYNSMLELMHYVGVSLDIAYQLIYVVQLVEGLYDPPPRSGSG